MNLFRRHFNDLVIVRDDDAFGSIEEWLFEFDMFYCCLAVLASSSQRAYKNPQDLHCMSEQTSEPGTCLSVDRICFHSAIAM